MTPRKHTQLDHLFLRKRNMFTHSATAPNNFCSVIKTRSIPRLVPQSLQNLSTENWTPLFWKRSVCTSVGWWLQGPCWACRGQGSALSFNENLAGWAKPPQRWISPALLLQLPPQHLQKAATSRSTNSLRGPWVTASLVFPEECLLLSTAPAQCTACTSVSSSQDMNPETPTQAQMIFRSDQVLKLRTGSCSSRNAWAFVAGQKWVYTKVFNTPRTCWPQGCRGWGAPSTQQLIKPQDLASILQFYIKQKCPHLQEKHFLKE